MGVLAILVTGELGKCEIHLSRVNGCGVHSPPAPAARIAQIHFAIGAHRGFQMNDRTP